MRFMMLVRGLFSDIEVRGTIVTRVVLGLLGQPLVLG